MHVWPIARYRFEFEVQTPIRLPEYAGSMLRGAFGSALRRTACMTREKDCKSCPLYRSCPYPAIFETPAPDSHQLQKFSQIPNPYIIEPLEWGERVYQSGHTLAFNMVLIGRALQQLPLISFAWQRAFAHDVGHGTAILRDIQHLNQDSPASVYQATTNRLQAHTGQVQLHAVQGDAFTLKFHTPLRLQENGRALPPSELTARDLLIALARRVSLLMEFHTDQPLGLNFAALATLAHGVPFTHNLKWRDWTRYSSRQQQKMQLGGATGKWQISQVPPPFHALLQVGQWLHVGKNATFGMGGYAIAPAVSKLTERIIKAAK
jgi:hypothetical protein